jgi:hypothetical protein
VECSLLSAEQSRAWLLGRVLAMLWTDWNMLDDEWVRANPDTMRERESQCRELIERVGNCITQTTIGGMTLRQSVAWAEAEAEKSRIIIIDPVTALSEDGTGSVRSPKEDKAFIGALKSIASRKSVSFWLIGHPKKGANDRAFLTLDDLPNGAAYQQNTDCITFFYKHEPAIDVEVRVNGIVEEHQVNRTFVVSKSREGAGSGATIGANFRFDFQWQEAGVVLKKLKKLKQIA